MKKPKHERIDLGEHYSESESMNSSSSCSSTGSSTACSSTTSSSLSSPFASTSSSTPSSSSSLSGDEDIIPLHDQKSKLKVFEKILSLISLLSEKSALHEHNLHHQLESAETAEPKAKLFSKKYQKTKLNFFYKAILDDINLNHNKIILYSLLRINLCRRAHQNDSTKRAHKQNNLFAVKFVDKRRVPSLRTIARYRSLICFATARWASWRLTI